MKWISLFIFFCLLCSCVSSRGGYKQKEEKTVIRLSYDSAAGSSLNTEVFSTPFGKIHLGDSMDKVRTVLGNPHRRSSHEQGELWFYYFEEDKWSVINFADGEVIGFEERQDVGVGKEG